MHEHVSFRLLLLLPPHLDEYFFLLYAAFYKCFCAVRSNYDFQHNGMRFQIFSLFTFHFIIVTIIFRLFADAFLFISWLKVRQSQNDFFKPTFPPKKRTNEFYFTTMKPQVDLFSFFFGGNWRHQQDISKLTDL